MGFLLYSCPYSHSQKEREDDAVVGRRQLKKMIDFTMFREFPQCKSILEFLCCSSERIAELTANWIRVGFCQGNFNSDNCLVSGTQMDYGPFGFIEKFNPRWNMWVGGKIEKRGEEERNSKSFFF